jgi:hypothetical protein
LGIGVGFEEVREFQEKVEHSILSNELMQRHGRGAGMAPRPLRSLAAGREGESALAGGARVAGGSGLDDHHGVLRSGTADFQVEIFEHWYSLKMAL